MQKVPGESLKGLAVYSANRHLINAEAVRARSYREAGELETKWPVSAPWLGFWAVLEVGRSSFKVLFGCKCVQGTGCIS